MFSQAYVCPTFRGYLHPADGMVPKSFQTGRLYPNTSENGYPIRPDWGGGAVLDTRWTLIQNIETINIFTTNVKFKYLLFVKIVISIQTWI